MPTTKKRLQITLPDHLLEILEHVCQQENISLSAKAVEFLEKGLEIAEDDALLAIMEERDTADTEFVSHEEAWA